MSGHWTQVDLATAPNTCGLPGIRGPGRAPVLPLLGLMDSGISAQVEGRNQGLGDP
jgi:hypothetical protein